MNTFTTLDELYSNTQQFVYPQSKTHRDQVTILLNYYGRVEHFHADINFFLFPAAVFIANKGFTYVSRETPMCYPQSHTVRVSNISFQILIFQILIFFIYLTNKPFQAVTFSLVQLMMVLISNINVCSCPLGVGLENDEN